MTYEPSRAALTLGAAIAAAACGSPSGAIPPLALGSQTSSLPATQEGGVFAVSVDVDGVPGPQVLVDTGAPYASLNVAAFQGAVPAGSGHVASLTLGGTVLWKVPTFGVAGSSTDTPDSGDGGILGFSVFGQFAMSFNYRDTQVIVGPPPLPDGLLDPISLPMSLEGGGPGLLPDGSVIDFAPSRVILTGSIEGANHIFLLDTGASSVALRTSLFDSIASDGRTQAQGSVRLVTGASTTSILRLKTVSVADADVEGPLAVSGSGIDNLLDGLQQEVG
ncbi:MAG TPA: pepsin/retropepsin-like aspartic protease family protein, partial [Polyangiaceae bacterium]